jgi:hypothetical protein
MAKSHPLFGIGLDSYGDHYLKYRSKNAAFFSMQTQSNAAHNVFLDLLSNGGFILFAAYLALVCYVAYCGIKVLKSMDQFNPYFTAIFVAWVGFQAQSIVSINQLGLAVWGWVLSGSIIGFYLSINNKKEVALAPKRNSRKIGSKPDLILPAIGLFIGLAISIPPFIADHNYRVAASLRDGNKVISSATSYPEDLGRTLSIAQSLANSKLVPQALNLAQHVTSV